MFLHTFHPQPIMFSLGPFNIYWYGFIITCGIAIGFLISLRLAKKYGVKRDYIVDLYFWLLIFGILGARLYHVLCEWQYYSANPLDIIKIWNGGLGIYGGVIAGVLVILVYSKRVARDKNLSFIIYHLSFSNIFWLTLDLLAPAVALGEAFGRWGNYFNQELFGRPTSLPWGIPINPITLPEAYRGYQFFHPVFLYQSLACFLIFAVILFLHYFRLKSAEESNKTKKQGSPPIPLRGTTRRAAGDHPQGDKLSIINYQLLTPGSIFLAYIILYSFSRFFLEFLRTDSQPILFDLRLGQWVSGLLFLAGVGWLARNKETRN